MLHPHRDAFRSLAKMERTIPLVQEILADMDTPLAIFRRVDDGETSFLFESVEGGEKWGRFSFIGLGARAIFWAKDHVLHVQDMTTAEGPGVPEQTITLAPGEDPLTHLRSLLQRLQPAQLPELPPRFAGGAVGFLAYDWVRYVEKLPDKNPDTLGVPDCYFVFPETVLVHDHMRQSLKLVQLVTLREGEHADRAYERGTERIREIITKIREPRPSEAEPFASPVEERLPMVASATREQYHAVVERARQYIRAGDIFQVVPSQRFSMPLRTDPFAIYRWLRVVNPSPYLFFLRAREDVVIGSSPELLVRLEAGEVTVRPIAGTRPRGTSEAEDLMRERELMADPKELAEHVMLVDLGRNDVGRVAEIGSVEVNELMVVERYSHVMHIVSNVRGKLRSGCDAVDVLRATFPAGTLTGAPKIRAMEIIDELETSRRGLYGGSVGYIDPRGNMDMCIAIRTLLVREGRIHVQAGGGVVADSDAEAEYQETLHKARATLVAIEKAGGGRTA